MLIINERLGISYNSDVPEWFWISDGPGGNGAVEIRVKDIDEYIDMFNQIKKESQNGT